MTNIEANARKRHQRTLLWAALVVSAICNAGTSIAGVSPVVSVVFGVLTLLCGAGLVAHHRRH